MSAECSDCGTDLNAGGACVPCDLEAMVIEGEQDRAQLMAMLLVLIDEPTVTDLNGARALLVDLAGSYSDTARTKPVGASDREAR